MQAGHVEAARVTRRHEGCGKLFAGMLLKGKRTRWRRRGSRKVGTSNTPSASAWLFRETLLDQRRSPAIGKGLPGRHVCEIHLRTVLRALAALGRGEPADSVVQLQIALPYELAVNGVNYSDLLGGLYSAYVRGEALSATHRYAEAAAEFQKILDHRGIVGADPIGALAHVQLGPAFVLSGERSGEGCLPRIPHALGKTWSPHPDA